VCKSENYEMDMTLDVNVELLPVEKEFKFSVELATTLNLDGTPDSGAYEQGQEKSADNRLSGCDYAMHGKVFKYDQLSANKMCVTPPPR
jgi:DNA-directed RNA polymerase I, II, and III subunit RPABC3